MYSKHDPDSFITVKLDYCNSLFYGLPEYLVYRLQSIQTAASHLITFIKKGSLHHTYSSVLLIRW